MHLLFEPHQREAHPLDLVVAQRAALHSPDRLALEQLPEELYEGEHELREPLLDAVRIDVHVLRQDATKSLHLAPQLRELFLLGHAGGHPGSRVAEPADTPPDSSIPANGYGGRGAESPDGSRQRSVTAISERPLTRASASRRASLRRSSVARAAAASANAVPNRTGRHGVAAQIPSMTR